MGLAQPTVGRHIDGLESALGLQLFTRSSDGFAPTEAAYELQPYAASMAATAAALRRVAASHGAGVRGTVRLTASEVGGVELLPPVVAHLGAAHPEAHSNLVPTNGDGDRRRREPEGDVPWCGPKRGVLVARHIGAIELGLHAHE